MVDLAALIGDLRAEGDDLDRWVAPLDEAAWRRPTPATGWTIAHQIAHLTWTDRAANAALTDAPRFEAEFLVPAASAAAEGRDPVAEGAQVGARSSAPELLARWRDSRAVLAGSLALRSADPAPVPWFGPPMSVPSVATARLMETWAHAQDVADTLGVTRTPTARLRHVAHLGVRTRDFAFALRGLTPPAEPFRVELTAPDGDPWTWGPTDAAQRVTGPAEDFCLLVTRRRAPADLAVTAVGADAATWLTIAQAYAGPPGTGRAPRAERAAGA